MITRSQTSVTTRPSSRCSGSIACGSSSSTPRLYELHPDAERRFLRWVGEVGEDPRTTLVVAGRQGQIIGFVYAAVERDLPIYLR